MYFSYEPEYIKFADYTFMVGFFVFTLMFAYQLNKFKTQQVDLNASAAGKKVNQDVSRVDFIDLLLI